MTEDLGEEASMAPDCQIAMETPIPLQLFNCLPYIFLLKTFFSPQVLYVAVLDFRHFGFVWKTANGGRQRTVAVWGDGEYGG